MPTQHALTFANTTRRIRGFNLMELMIVVAVIGIIGAIAYPQYRQYAMESRRSEGQAALASIAALQERYYSNNNSYATMAQLGAAVNTDNNYYALAVVAGPVALGLTGNLATSFLATATAQNLQAVDTVCTTLRVDSTGAKTALDNGNADSTASCW